MVLALLLRLAEGNSHGQYDTSHGGMNAREQHAGPKCRAEREICPEPHDTEPVESEKHRGNERRKRKGESRQVGGVKNGDDEDCAEVIDNGERC